MPEQLPLLDLVVRLEPRLLALPVDFEDEIDGLSRIYGDLTDIGDESFASDTPLPDRFYYLWSTSNPQMPIAASRPAANALSGQSTGQSNP